MSRVAPNASEPRQDAPERRANASRSTSRIAQPLSSRDKILETAVQLFAQRGLEGVGMREVAGAVGLSKSALFHHFPTKLELYSAVHEAILEAVDTKLSAADRSDRDAFARLERWVEVVIDHLAEHPSHARLMVRSLFDRDEYRDDPLRTRIDERVASILGRVYMLLEHGIRSGELRDISVPHTLQTLIGMTVYHFASGELGDELFGTPVFSAVEVARRKEHVLDFLTQALARRT